MINWMQQSGVDVSKTADGINTIRNSSTTTGGQEKDLIKMYLTFMGVIMSRH